MKPTDMGELIVNQNSAEQSTMEAPHSEPVAKAKVKDTSPTESEASQPLTESKIPITRSEQLDDLPIR